MDIIREGEPNNIELEGNPATGDKQEEQDATFDELKSEQQEEKDYFEKKEEKINKTKEKLQELLEKLKEEPPKETIAKKILRFRINRLRTQLNRNMERFNIEYKADLEENENYNQFLTECDEIRKRIEELEDKEDDLEYGLEYYTRKENYRGEVKERIEASIQKVAPKSQKKSDKTKTIKRTPRKSKTQEIKSQLDEVKTEIDELQTQLQEKIEKYKEYKTDLKRQVKSDVATRMQELKDEEATRKQKQKEELAITKPSVWSNIRNFFKKAIDKVSEWNENRRQAKAEKSKKQDENVSRDAKTTIAMKTAREQFLEDNRINPILKEYIEASKSNDFSVREKKSEFIEEMKKKGYSLEQLREGMRAIDTYRQEQVSEDETKKYIADEVKRMMDEKEKPTVLVGEVVDLPKKDKELEK